MDIVLVTTIISSSFPAIAAAEPLAARLRLPYTAMPACMGILIGGGATFFPGTESVGYALAWVAPLPLTACLLIGAIVSTTDPAAVVSIFRSIAALVRSGRRRRAAIGARGHGRDDPRVRAAPRHRAQRG